MPRDEGDLPCLDLPRADAVRAGLPSTDIARATVERARALADPTRLPVAVALAVGGELCVCDVAWVCGLAQNLVSHHVRQLRVAGLAASRRDGRLVMYRLTAPGPALLAAVLPGTAPAPAPEPSPPFDRLPSADVRPIPEVH